MFPIFGMGSIMNDLEHARQDAMNARAAAMQQQMGLGSPLGGLAGLAGIGQAQRNALMYGSSLPREAYIGVDMAKPKTVREELQRDTDKWLEDVKL